MRRFDCFCPGTHSATPAPKLARHARRFFGLLLAAALGAGSLRAQPAASLNLSLPQNSQGVAVIQTLGSHLPDVAQAYGLDPQKLVTLLQTQPSLAVDRSGALHFLCASQQGTTVPISIINATTGATDYSDAFHLHSLPGATRVIYLDFDGHTTSGTNWNTTYTKGAPIVSAPFDLDGSPTTFNATEMTMIKHIWQRVAEDFAPFNVDVTTEDPGVEALRKTSSSDLAYGIRVVVSPTNWYGNAGGTSYVGSFSWSSDTPVFVFTQQLANTEKAIAECCSHETGHSMGLHHQGLGGSSPTEYYSGQGNWAPIMGNSYSRPVTQWAKGEYLNANNKEDALAIMQGYAPLMVDDHGDTLATASILAGPNVADGGAIERRGDVDVFRFDADAGAMSLSIRGFAPQTDLNLVVQLLDAAGNILQVTSPTVLGTTINRTLSAGTYYLRLYAVGEADPLTTGYSDYASLGNYVILGTIPSTGTKQAPVAVVSANPTSGTAPLAVQFTGQNSSDPDGTIVSYQWDLGNGTSSTLANPACTYTTPGTYLATLTVTDNDGLTRTAATTITVTAAPDPNNDVDVRQFSLTTARDKNGTYAVATILIRDRLDRPVSNATVNLQWSGLLSTSTSGKTDASGQVIFTSPRSQKRGNVTASVLSVVPATTTGHFDDSIYSEPLTRTVTF